MLYHFNKADFKFRIPLQRSFVTGFTLLEALITAVIVILMASIALPNFYKGKEHALGGEAKTSLRFIYMAERSYDMENKTFYPSSGTESGLGNINTNLKIALNSNNWSFSILGGATTFTATASRNGAGGYLDCQYTVDENSDTPAPVVPANCP